MKLPAYARALLDARRAGREPWLTVVAIGRLRDTVTLAGVPGVARIGWENAASVHEAHWPVVMGLDVLVVCFGALAASEPPAREAEALARMQAGALACMPAPREAAAGAAQRAALTRAQLLAWHREWREAQALARVLGCLWAQGEPATLWLRQADEALRLEPWCALRSREWVAEPLERYPLNPGLRTPIQRARRRALLSAAGLYARPEFHAVREAAWADLAVPCGHAAG